MDVDENAGLFDGYELKLNSYDLGVDIELADAVQRLRFEHPEVKVVVLKSGKDRVFCAGANIRMLAGSTHAHKVNFCKFTNETRNAHRGCERALRPEVPLRRQRHGGRRRLRAGAGRRPHHAGRRRQLDRVAARAAAARRAARHRRAHARHRQAQGAPRPAPTSSAPSRKACEGKRAVEVAAGRPGRCRTRKFDAAVAETRPASSPRSRIGPPTRKGIALTPLERTIDGDARRPIRAVKVEIDRAGAPRDHHHPGPDRRRRRPSPTAMHAAGRRSSGRCALARELDDAILHLRAQRARDRHAGLQEPRAIRRWCSAYDALLDANARPLAGARDPATTGSAC